MVSNQKVFDYFLPIGSNDEKETTKNEYLTESSLNNAIGRLFYRGVTSDMVEGLSLAREILIEEPYGIPMGIPKTILVISAGSSDNRDQVIAEAVLIKDEKIRVITIGVGKMVS